MTDTLFEEWQAYKKIVENDYMGHARFFNVAVAAIRQRFSAPVAILDLGCGDASPIHSVLDAVVVDSYCGVDDSDSRNTLVEFLHDLGSVVHFGDLQLQHGPDARIPNQGEAAPTNP